MAFPHFVPEKFSMTVLKCCLNEQSRATYKNVFKIFQCVLQDYFWLEALQKYRTLKNIIKGVGTLNALNLDKMIQEFEMTGSFDMQYGKGGAFIGRRLKNCHSCALSVEW